MPGAATQDRTGTRLALAALAGLPAEVRPRVDPRGLGVGIVHLGIGAFHRAHQATFTEDAMAAAGGDWGICGVTQRSDDVVAALAPQDGLYTVAIRDRAGQRLRVTGAVRELLWARADPEGVLDRIAAPTTSVVSLTVSEKAYHHDPATDRLRTGSPDVAADLADGGTRTVVAQLAKGLDRRRRRDGGPITVVCCDNLPHNGRVLARLVSDFVAHRGGRTAGTENAALLAWIERAVRFPCTMVDRIVPATTAGDREAIAVALGVEDRGPVVTEPFRQWVVEDDFAGPRPAWERAGVTLTADVAPYERIKLRMLNGSHSTLACLGALAGHTYIHKGLASGVLPAVARALMDDDVAPTLDVPAGFHLGAYRDQVLERFANAALPYRTLQVAMDGSQKLPSRLLDTVRARRRAGAEPAVAALGVAAWMRYIAVRCDDRGRRLEVSDPLAEAIAQRLHGRTAPREIAGALLAMTEIFGDELGGDDLFREVVVEHLERLELDGAEVTASRVVG